MFSQTGTTGGFGASTTGFGAAKPAFGFGTRYDER